MYNRSKRQKQIGRSVGKGIGHFFSAMQINGFIDKDEFKKQIDEWIQVFRNTNMWVPRVRREL